MDPLRSERGQALVIAALVLAIAVVAIGGLRLAQDRLLEAARDARAGEAAVAAAGAAVADRYFALARELGRDLSELEIEALAADPGVLEAAREAAAALARLHGRADPTDVRVRAFGYEIEVDLRLAGRRHVALLESLP